MHFGRPLWNQDLAGLFVRVPLGGYFFLIGQHTLSDMDSFVANVKRMGVLPDQLATLYAVLLPYLEVSIGILLMVGMWTTLAAILSTVLLFSFIFATGIFPFTPTVFNKDFILAGAALSLLASGAGAISIDTFRKKG